jgi:RHO1 GDP-GTP exchange protein 1/2
MRWEIVANSYVFLGGKILLMSADFVEVRDVETGCLVQVIEGKEIKLVSSDASEPTGGEGVPLLAMRGEKDDDKGRSEQLVEIIETAPLTAMGRQPGQQFDNNVLWDEWD